MSHAPQNPPQKLSTLNVTAFVLSLLVILPLVPIIGAILGIVGVARNRPDLRGRGLAIAAIPVGFCMVIIVQGILAAVAIPAFVKYQRKAKEAEATESISRLRRAAQSQAGETGHFPVGRTQWVPATPCCEQMGRRCAPQAADWSPSPWPTLDFRMLDRHRYQYRYLSDGQNVRIEARGDLNCNGRYSSFRLQGSIQDGQPVFAPLEVDVELE